MLAKEKAEFELHRIRNQALDIVKSYEQVNWDEIYHCVRATEFKYMEKYFVKQIKFLKARIPEMRNILTQDLGIKQTELFASDSQKHPKNQNREN